MPVDDFHRDVAAIALRTAGTHGFALGGGNALIAHGITSRPTEDVDLFTNEDDGVRAAAGAVGDALREAGEGVERRDVAGGLADVFDGIGDGAQMMLQMAYFDRGRRPVTMEVGPVPDLPVLHLEDVIGSKVCALASRVEPRDYVDTAAALEHYTVDQLITLAKRLDPGLEDRDFADAGRQLDQMPDRLFTRYKLSQKDVGRLRERFAGWPRS